MREWLDEREFEDRRSVARHGAVGPPPQPSETGSPVSSIEDVRERARRRCPRFLFDYADGGALTESTLRRNRTDLDAIAVRQRVLTDVSKVDTAVDLFGERWSLPLALAPVGMAGMYARRGEVQAARAARAANVPFCLSTVGACSLEEVRAGVGAPTWFQLYMIRDRTFLTEMLARAQASGVTTLVFTVDMPVPSIRRRDLRSGLSGGRGATRQVRRWAQAVARPSWCWDVGLRGHPHSIGNISARVASTAGIDGYWAWMADNFDPTASWTDLEEVRRRWSGALIVKGILDPDDARRAVDIGVDGVVVSNHGGRQLDGATSSISALPAIADVVGDSAIVLLDGGIRSGVDIVRALALGARGVLIGRPWVYGLAADGERGVRSVLELLEKELRVTMALAGATSVAMLGAHTLHTG